MIDTRDEVESALNSRIISVMEVLGVSVGVREGKAAIILSYSF